MARRPVHRMGCARQEPLEERPEPRPPRRHAAEIDAGRPAAHRPINPRRRKTTDPCPHFQVLGQGSPDPEEIAGDEVPALVPRAEAQVEDGEVRALEDVMAPPSRARMVRSVSSAALNGAPAPRSSSNP